MAVAPGNLPMSVWTGNANDGWCRHAHTRGDPCQRGRTRATGAGTYISLEPMWNCLTRLTPPVPPQVTGLAYAPINLIEADYLFANEEFWFQTSRHVP